MIQGSVDPAEVIDFEGKPLDPEQAARFNTLVDNSGFNRIQALEIALGKFYVEKEVGVVEGNSSVETGDTSSANGQTPSNSNSTKDADGTRSLKNESNRIKAAADRGRFGPGYTPFEHRLLYPEEYTKSN